MKEFASVDKSMFLVTVDCNCRSNSSITQLNILWKKFKMIVEIY